MGVYVPEDGVAGQQLNVAVSCEPSVVQEIVERQVDMRNTVIAVLLRDRVIARNIDPGQWIGSLATPDLRERLHTGATGFGSSRTLEGTETLAYLTPPDRYGVSVVIGAPQSELSGAAWRTTSTTSCRRSPPPCTCSSAPARRSRSTKCSMRPRGPPPAAPRSCGRC